MGQFDATIKELERADRVITQISEENKKLKIELQYLQNCREEMKKAKHERDHAQELARGLGEQVADMEEELIELRERVRDLEGQP